MAFDYKKEYKEFYMPKNKPGIIEIPKMNYIAVRGKGNPNEENGEYKSSIGLLYGIAFTIKMSYKGTHKIEGFFEYVVPPLEGLWWQENTQGLDYARKEDMHFISMIRLPDFVTKEDFEWAVQEATKKKKQDFSKVEFFPYDEGMCVQCMHIGSYDDEPATVDLMHDYLGLTKEEYQIFLAQGNQALKDILDSQRVFRRFCIYQLCLGETQTVPFAFKQLDALRKAGYEQPPAAAYQTVWSAEVCCPKGQNDMEVLGRLFLDYNEHLPEDYRGRPLAPSDVVELDCQGKRTYFYVNDCRDFAPV